MQIISEYKKRPSRWTKDSNGWRRTPVTVPAGHKMVMAIENGRTVHILVPYK